MAAKNVSLLLGNNAKNALLLQRGQFFNASGGKWVYVLNEQGNGATRRPIKLGRKNDQYYQVLSGLEAGEQVITSSYDRFPQADTLQFEG